MDILYLAAEGIRDLISVNLSYFRKVSKDIYIMIINILNGYLGNFPMPSRYDIALFRKSDTCVDKDRNVLIKCLKRKEN